jgi:translation initiation factor 1
MSRLFAGTPWDRPPTCDRCGKLETECGCLPLAAEPLVLPPEKAGVARLTLEKRKNGKLVSLITGLKVPESQLADLAATLKTRCGVGGTFKDGEIELQGDQLARVEGILKSLGYRTRT